MAIRSAFAVRVATTLGAQPCVATKKPIATEAPLAGHAGDAIMWLPDGSGLVLKKLEEASTRQTAAPVFDWANRNVLKPTVQPPKNGKHTTAFFEDRFK